MKIALLIAGNKEYSFSGQTIQSRRQRKLKVREV